MRTVLLFAFLLSACATRFDPGLDYSETLKKAPEKGSSRTVVLFLIDGLSFQTLQPQLQKGKLPQLRQHFLSSQSDKIYEARSLFPSLTFPAIASLLKGAPVHQTGATGNTLVYKSRVASFESVRDREKFTQIMTGENVFTRMTEQGQASVSLDYGLGPDATVSSSTADLKLGFAATTEDYLYLDQKKLASLKLILSKNPPRQWPKFIFIHLVGLDFLSHQHGSKSPEALQYLDKLDASLAEVFQLLKSGETENHQVISMLTADHGFSPKIRRSVELEKELQSLDPDLHSFNEHRMASVFAKAPPAKEKLQAWTKALLTKPGIEIVASRHGNTVQVSSKYMTAILTFASGACPYNSKGVSLNNGPFVCPNELEMNLRQPLFYPFFLENLAYFFQAEKHPDFVVIPNADAVFAKGQGGYHGGPTINEVIVPLMMRNATLADPKSIPAIWEILNFL
jgi:predicted AlkP superfamily pyrophosphatase or phosphodiesterase